MMGFKAMGRGWGIAGVFMLTAIGWGCTKELPQLPQDDAGDVRGVDRGVGGSDARSDGRPDISGNTQSMPPANVRFPDPPQMTCSGPSDCDFPPSACADRGCDAGSCPGASWVVYYDHPQCTAGQCVFEPRYFQCSGLEYCSGGGCQFNGTAAP